MSAKRGSFSTVATEVVGWLMSASAESRGKARERCVWPDGCDSNHQIIPCAHSETGDRIMRYELADYEWTAIKPLLPNKPCGVPRVNDRRVLNGIFWVFAIRNTLA